MSARKLHGRFYFEDWSSPDPHDEALDKAVHALRYGGELTQDDRYRLASAVEAYMHFAGHPASTKIIVSQLRKLRAAVKADATKPVEVSRVE